MRMSQGRKFVHVSVRIPIELKSELENAARRQDTNFNSLVNHVLSRYASFERITNQMEAIPVNRFLFDEMLNDVPTEEMERIGKKLGPKLVKQAFAFLNLDYDMDGLIRHYFRPVSSFARWYSFDMAGSGSNRRLMFEHNHGSKWSVFLKHYIAGIVKSATGSEPRVAIDDSLVTVYY